MRHGAVLLLAALAAAPAQAQAPAPPPTGGVPAPVPPPPAAPAPTAGQTAQRFLVFNTGQSPIVSVQASPVTDQNWGTNLIGRVNIPTGSALAITPRDRGTCLFDMRVVWADGRQVERRRENFCGLSRVFRLDGTQGR